MCAYVQTTVTEQLARARHRSYVAACLQRGEAPASRPSLRPWDELLEEFRASSRDQARHAADKLAAIGCLVMPASDAANAVERLDPDEIALLARMEHERWVRERLAQEFRARAGPPGRPASRPGAVGGPQRRGPREGRPVRSRRSRPALRGWLPDRPAAASGRVSRAAAAYDGTSARRRLVVAVSGWSGPSARTRMASARSRRGRAAARSPWSSSTVPRSSRPSAV